MNYDPDPFILIVYANRGKVNHCSFSCHVYSTGLAVRNGKVPPLGIVNCANIIENNIRLILRLKNIFERMLSQDLF
jgi:hypothetical protein